MIKDAKIKVVAVHVETEVRDAPHLCICCMAVDNDSDTRPFCMSGKPLCCSRSEAVKFPDPRFVSSYVSPPEQRTCCVFVRIRESSWLGAPLADQPNHDRIPYDSIPLVAAPSAGTGRGLKACIADVSQFSTLPKGRLPQHLAPIFRATARVIRSRSANYPTRV